MGFLRTYTYANTHTQTHWSYPSCGGNEDNNGDAEGQRQHQSCQHGRSLFHTLQEGPVERLVAAAHPLSDRPPGDQAPLVLLLVVPPHVDTVSGLVGLVIKVSGWRGALFLSIHSAVCRRDPIVFINVVLHLFAFRMWLREIQRGHIVGLFEGASVKLGQPLIAQVCVGTAARVTVVATTTAAADCSFRLVRVRQAGRFIAIRSLQCEGRFARQRR